MSRTAFAQVPGLKPDGLGAAQDARALERHDRVLDRIERHVIAGYEAGILLFDAMRRALDEVLAEQENSAISGRIRSHSPATTPTVRSTRWDDC